MKTKTSQTHFEANELTYYLCEIMGVEMANALMIHVHDHNLLGHLFEIAFSPECFAQGHGERQKIGFHAAWVLELYFAQHPNEFKPLISQFCESFPDTKNESAKRHFCKIMKIILSQAEISLSQELILRMVEACSNWVMNPKSKIAVRLGAVEIVALLRRESDVARDVLPLLIEQMKENASPALWARMRQWNSSIMTN